MWQLLLTIVGIFVATVGMYEGVDYVRKTYFEPADSLDVEILLRKRGLWNAFSSGEIKCAGCGGTVSFANLGTLVEPEGKDRIDFVCRNPICLENYIREYESKMWSVSENAS